MRDGSKIAARLVGHPYSKGWMFRCPCHEDRVPSCSIRNDGLITCFAGCPRDKVEAALDALGFTDTERHERRSRAEQRAYIEQSIREAQQEWEDIHPTWLRDHADRVIDGRNGIECSLRARKITLPCPPVLRPYSPNGYVCAVQQLDGTITAVQVRQSSFPGSRRWTYGHLGEGAVRLTEPTGDELGLAEGVETALSATQIFGIPCWATLGSKRLDAVQLPANITRVHIFGDNDDPGRQGVQNAVARYCRREYRHVTVHWPDEKYNDFNDVLRGRKMYDGENGWRRNTKSGGA